MVVDASRIGQMVVLDNEGLAQVPNRPYTMLEEKLSLVRPGWRSVDEMVASIRAQQIVVTGLPPGAPNPNDVYEKDGEYVRYVVDTSERKEYEVVEDVVTEEIRMVSRLVSLSLAGAREATANGRDADYWNGFTWIRDGFKPERDFPSMMQQADRGRHADLVFRQPVAPTEERRLRHEMDAISRRQGPLPVHRAVEGTVTAATSAVLPPLAVEEIPETLDGASAASSDPDAPERRGPGRPRKDEIR